MSPRTKRRVTTREVAKLIEGKLPPDEASVVVQLVALLERRSRVQKKKRRPI